jgi:predicted nucleotide-binding protein
MKKKIFIGSSTEAKSILDEVEKQLCDEYEILRWDKSFSLNMSTLDSLIENAIKVDRAIFIGTGDDYVTDKEGKRGTKTKHRDNVVFEFGLFLGMLGRKDCVYLVDNKSDIMSDYLGVTVVMFDKEDISNSIPKSVSQIKEHFNSYSKRDINLFPSVSLASAYFVNFIQPIFNHYLNNSHTVITDKRSYKE